MNLPLKKRKRSPKQKSTMTAKLTDLKGSSRSKTSSSRANLLEK